jgi:hypothetical protein
MRRFLFSTLDMASSTGAALCGTIPKRSTLAPVNGDRHAC